MASPIEAVTPRDGFAVTPSDTAVFRKMASALYVGGTGDVTVRTEAGTSLLFSAVPVGAILPVRCDKVMATGTTATLIVALTY